MAKEPTQMPHPEEVAAQQVPARKAIEGEIMLCRGSTFKPRFA
jgi:hypothetical protein